MENIKTYYDSHTHLDWYENQELLVQQLVDSGIFCLAASVDEESFEKNLEIAEKVNKLSGKKLVIPTFGVHPCKVKDFLERISLQKGQSKLKQSELKQKGQSKLSLETIYLQKGQSKLLELMEASPIIGEIGMDFCWYKDASPEQQEQVFRFFLDHCNKYKKYCVIHTKDAEQQIAEILLDYPDAKPIIHWYDGPEDVYREFIRRQYMTTFGCETSRSEHIQKLLKITPPELILCETDNPTGETWLGGTDNSPMLIKRVYKDVAKVLGMSEEVFNLQMRKNWEKITGVQEQRPLFHFSTPVGWCNDPNGFSQFGDKVHLFFQYHPYSTQWGPMHWGHVTSQHLLEWKLEPIALAPDSSADYKGCFSGTAIESDGKHVLIYTGVSGEGEDYFQKQCIAVGNGQIYEKSAENPVISAKNIPFVFKTTDFRDPKIWKKNNIFYCACVLKQQNDSGALVLFESTDYLHWSYKGMLDSSKDGLSKMWECPDVLTLDGKDLLILSPQEMKTDYDLGFHDGNNSVYITGKLDYEAAKFIREPRVENDYTAAQIDYGIDFYAPETAKLKDGRTVMIGWMQAWESYITPADYSWSGMMTIPREISIKNNRLYQLPVRELENWKVQGTVQRGIIPAAEKNQKSTQKTQRTQIYCGKRHFELDLQTIENSTGSFTFILETCENQQVKLEINLTEKYIAFDRSKSLTPGAISYRKAKMETFEKIKILCDTNSLEVFIDDGKMAFSNTFFFSSPVSSVSLENWSNGKISYNLWEIKTPKL